MTVLNLLLGVMAGILLVGVIGETERKKHANITIAFVAVLIVVAALNIIDILA